MKAELTRDMPGEDGQVKPAGTVIDHPQAFYLVRMGVARPADEECERRAQRSPKGQKAAQHAYERTNRGIHPEDFEAYDAGWMQGYAKTTDAPRKDLLGNTSNIWEPGPKWAEYQALLEQQADELTGEDDEADDANPAS